MKARDCLKIVKAVVVLAESVIAENETSPDSIGCNNCTYKDSEVNDYPCNECSHNYVDMYERVK